MKRILKSISYMAVMATAVATFSSCEDELPDPIVKTTDCRYHPNRLGRLWFE